jgi:HK97 family phage major capsid protein
LSFFFKVSRELLADSANIDGALQIAIAQAMAVAMDAAGLRGAGRGHSARHLGYVVVNDSSSTPT